MTPPFLLPYRFKLVGIMLTIAGIVLGVLFLWFDFRFTMPVFAVYSAFVEVKICEIFRTNFADELTMLTLFAGLSLITFSKEKTELEIYREFRMKAMYRAVYANIIILFASVLFVYGSGFLAIMLANFYSVFILNLVFFYTMKTKYLMVKRRDDK